MYNVIGIFGQGHMPVMWNLYMPVPLVTLLIAVSCMRYVYWHSCLISIQELICICGINVALEENICCWNIGIHMAIA